MAVARDDPFVGGEVGSAHGPPGVDACRWRWPISGAEAVFTAVGEARLGVDHDAGGIDAATKRSMARESVARMASV